MTTVDIDRELKTKHRALWASGDYPAVAADLIPEFGPELVRACGVRAGDRVLDVAAGSGNAAIPAAEAGATVVASDLTPELFDAGRRIAAQRGVELEWAEADAEALPFADDGYDAVFAVQTLHHIEALEHLLDQIRSSLTDRGLFVVNEYVGPTRFQFPDERLPLMNDLLLTLPESHRRSLRTGQTKTEVLRPNEKEVYEVDPSESVRSDEIMGLIEERFEIVYRADFGGTLLQFVLSDIAGNFDPADPKDVAMIDLVCLYEKTLIDEGVLPSDFVYLVARRSS